MNPLVVGDYGTWAIKIFFVVTNYVFGYFKKIIQVLIIAFFFFSIATKRSDKDYFGFRDKPEFIIFQGVLF